MNTRQETSGIRRAEEPWFAEHHDLLDSLEELMNAARGVFAAQGYHLLSVFPIDSAGRTLTIMTGGDPERAAKIMNGTYVSHREVYATISVGEYWMGPLQGAGTDCDGHKSRICDLPESQRCEVLSFCLQCRDGAEIDWFQIIDREEDGTPRLSELFRFPMELLKGVRLDLDWSGGTVSDDRRS